MDSDLPTAVVGQVADKMAPYAFQAYNAERQRQLGTAQQVPSLTAVGGALERDEDGIPYKYVFKVTDYISELLKSDESINLVKLGIKVYNSSDAPTSSTDVALKNYSWNPKGVVLYNQNASAGEKRVKLEVTYTKLNN